MMHDYWHQNWWFAKTFRAGTRALAAADKGPLSLPSAAASGNEDSSERANGLADRRGSAPGLQITTDRTEPSPAPLDFDEEMQRRSHPPQSSATASDEGSMT